MIDTSVRSPNHSTRAANRVRALVIHATAGSWQSALSWLMNPVARVSAHYLIAKDGRTWQLVDEGRTAWHAGISQWRDLEVWATNDQGVRVPSLNPVSVGIELENLNTGRDPYPAAQLTAAVALSRSILTRHQIARANLVRHLDISPGRKTDPAGLDWPAFVAAVFDVPPPATHRARSLAYVRSLPTTQSNRLRQLQKGDAVRVVRVVRGQMFQHSDQWAELGGSGYVWLPQLEAL